jgi:hypothetical protein
MRVSAIRKLNALRVMVASGVIRVTYGKRDEFTRRQHRVPTENPAAEFDHLAPFNVVTPTIRSVRGHNHVSRSATLLWITQ